MPLSEKEIIERLPDWIAEKKTSFLFGSGTSSPGMPLMSKFQDKEDGLIDINGLMYEIIKRNKFLIGAEMKEKLSEEESEAILGTLSTYKKFVEILLDMLGNVNSRERHKISIFLQLIMTYSSKKQLMIFMRVGQLLLSFLMMAREATLSAY